MDRVVVDVLMNQSIGFFFQNKISLKMAYRLKLFNCPVNAFNDILVLSSF